jgi:hypothetical protein
MSDRETEIGDDAELILLCAKVVACFAELRALNASDQWAPDRGPLHARYERVLEEEGAALARIEELPNPTTLAGAKAAARAALVQGELDAEGKPVLNHVGDRLSYAAVGYLAGRAAP